jgi:hypothetical protein
MKGRARPVPELFYQENGRFLKILSLTSGG